MPAIFFETAPAPGEKRPIRKPGKNLQWHLGSLNLNARQNLHRKRQVVEAAAANAADSLVELRHEFPKRNTVDHALVGTGHSTLIASFKSLSIVSMVSMLSYKAMWALVESGPIPPSNFWETPRKAFGQR